MQCRRGSEVPDTTERKGGLSMTAVFIASALLTFALIAALLLCASLVMCVVHLRQKRRAPTPTPQSISTPLGLKAYRQVNTHAPLPEAVHRARSRREVRG